MKTLIFGTVASVGMLFGLSPQDASAHWETRIDQRWDPACCRYVAYEHRYWVPDPCFVEVHPRVYYHGPYRPEHRPHHFHHER